MTSTVPQERLLPELQARPAAAARIAALAALLLPCAFHPVSAGAESADPERWLERMTVAVQATNYEGTVIRLQGGVAEALKVVHTVSDGVIRERVVAQEGNGLEIIRNGNEVHCILPDSNSVLVEEWNDQSTLFSTLPSKELRIGKEYDVIIKDYARVAGRKAVKLAINPHDEYRYGHHLWLDTETGLPLQTRLIATDGATLEEVRFADIRISNDIQLALLQPSYDVDSFRWYTDPGRGDSRPVDPAWRSDDLPVGFRVVSAHEETLPGGDDVVTHTLYSDGLASVSVFIAGETDAPLTERSRVGASNSYSLRRDGFTITAVGDVPAVTVEKIARGTALR